MIVNLFKKPFATNIDIDGKLHKIAWMHYDYYSLKEVKNFAEYFQSDASVINLSEQEGTSQSMYLYSSSMISKELSDKLQGAKFKFELQEEEQKTMVVITENGQVKIPEFLCLMTIKLRPLHENETYESYLAASIERLECILKENEDVKNVYYEWFSTLGEEDLVLLAAGDSIKEFTIMLEQIRCEETLYSTYSFTLSNKKVIDVENLDVDASVSITIKPSAASRTYIQTIQEKILDLFVDDEEEKAKIQSDYGIKRYLEEQKGFKFYGMVGKYDYYIFVPKNTWNFLKEFNSHGIFDVENGLYNANVYQTKTSWLYEMNFDSPAFSQENSLLQEFMDVDSKTKGWIDKVEQLVKKVKDDAAGYMRRSFHIDKALDLLYFDFEKNIKSMFASEWKEDLYEQFAAFLEILQSIQKQNVNLQSDILEEMINSIRQTYIHITQASRLFFEIPATNLRYTGSYNKMLKAYYGIVKRCLYIAYSIKKNEQSKQSILVPVITFEYTSKVNTHLYVQSGTTSDKRLVVFHLPYDALTNMPKYMGYLCHEVYHYISPVDRRLRNQVAAQICLYSYYESFLEAILYNYLLDGVSYNYNNIVKQIVRIFLEENYSFIIDCAEKQYNGFIIKDAINSIDKKGKSFSNFMELMREEIKTDFYITDENGNLKGSLKTVLKQFLENYVKLREDVIQQVVTGGREEYAREIVKKLNNMKMEDVLSKVKFSTQKEKLIIDDTLYYFGIMEHALKEACCDFFAIQMLDMDFEEYLSYIATFLYDSGMYDRNNKRLFEAIKDKNERTSLSKRIGIIIYHYNVWKKKPVNVDSVKKQINGATLKIRSAFFENEQADEKNELISSFKELFIISYESYFNMFELFLDTIDNLITTGIISDEMVSGNEMLAQYLDEMRRTFKYYIQLDNSKKYSNGIFKNNIDIMQISQKHPSFEDLKKQIEDNTLKEIKVSVKCLERKYTSLEAAKKSRKWEREVSDFHEYIQEIIEIGNYLNDGNSSRINFLWYRGQPNKEFNLTPNLMRIKDLKVSLLDFEVALMNLYRSKVTYLKEEEAYTDFDWTVLMQHYEMPTHLLDWSEDAYTALFFALTKGDKKEPYKLTDRDAAVYVLKPEAMCEAREVLIEGNSSSMKKVSYPIVNLSLPYQSKEYEYFMPIVPEKNLEKRKSEWNFEGKKESKVWPVPIVCNLSNPRIRSQHGTFTAFNLMAEPKKIDGKDELSYDYLAIENMQEEFLKKYPDKKPFLYKIILPEDRLSQFMADLKQTGIRVMNVYPELDNIGKDIKEQVINYFTSK